MPVVRGRTCLSPCYVVTSRVVSQEGPVTFSLGEPERFSSLRLAEASAFERGDASPSRTEGAGEEEEGDGEEAGMSEAVEGSLEEALQEEEEG